MGCCVSGRIFPVQNSHADLNGFHNNGKRLSSGRSTEMGKRRSDIRLPLTEKEIFTLTRSWKPIAKNMVDTGINMFLRYGHCYFLTISIVIQHSCCLSTCNLPRKKPKSFAL